MEKIGTSGDNSAIVKLSEIEWAALTELQFIANDMYDWEVYGYRYPGPERDLSPLFVAIRLWISARRQIARLEQVCKDAIEIMHFEERHE
jgi:hypothetical protein